MFTEQELADRAIYFRRQRRKARRITVNNMASEAYEHILRDLKYIDAQWEGLDEGFTASTADQENLTLRAVIKLQRRVGVLVQNAHRQLEKRSVTLNKQRRRALKQQYKEKVLAALAAEKR